MLRVPWAWWRHLLSDNQRDDFCRPYPQEYETVRIQHARKNRVRPPVTLEAARDNDLAFDWGTYTPPVARLGVREVEASIETLRNYHIDWTPFFYDTVAGRQIPAHSGR